MNDELDLKEIGRRIRTQRESLNLTREKLAEKLGVSSKFCGDIEYGTKGMSVNTLVRLSKILNLSIDYIIKGYEYSNKEITDKNDLIKESILAPLSVCNNAQLKRAEQMMRIFVAAVNEGENGDEEEG
ncbi:helix-turn-helix domain-containing protein [Anaerovorax odorimutans]|uniref:helix-turn-helix domain-containing protein n=1 Tax=Anaerovorax odorimutans TaxID=109327 RepID=UPI00041E4F3D|nr:helix-turn-helix transcriptional regulator [Anaerovorax odorimutans]